MSDAANDAPGGAFLSCDWGTSALRLRLAAGDPPAVLAEVKLDEGAARVHALAGAARGREREELFAGVLRRACGELARAAGPGRFPRGAPVVISGMAGSSIGWREVPYAECPLSLDGSGARTEGLGRIAHEAGEHDVTIISGLKTAGDVMRGEETEAIGLLADPELAPFRGGCILVLPGTHSKHVRIEDRAIRGFSTYMTGELFAVLQETGILRHSIAPGGVDGASSRLLDEPELADTFRLGARHALGRGLSAALFAVRTNALLGGMDPLRNRWFLSGVLIGAEVVDAVRLHPASIPILLAANAALSPAYGMGFEAIGAGHRVRAARPEAVERAVLRGQATILRAAAGRDTA